MSDSILVYYGTDPYAIKQASDNAIAQAGIASEDVLSFDMEEADLGEAVEAAMTIPFFSDRKAIVLRNCAFLSSKPSKDALADPTPLFRYFEYPSPSTLLVVMVPSDKLDLKKDILNLLELHGTIQKFESSKKQDLYEIVRSTLSLDGMTIEPDALEELIRRVDENATMLEHEVQKLTSYAAGKRTVTLAMVEAATPRNLEDNVYELVNQIVAKNRTAAMRLLQDLTRLNVDAVFLTTLVASKFQEILTAKALIKNKKTFDEMMKHFGYSKGRMYYVQKNASEMDADLLARYIDELETLDYKIKSGQLDKLLGFEMFLLGI